MLQSSLLYLFQVRGENSEPLSWKFLEQVSNLDTELRSETVLNKFKSANVNGTTVVANPLLSEDNCTLMNNSCQPEGTLTNPTPAPSLNGTLTGISSRPDTTNALNTDRQQRQHTSNKVIDAGNGEVNQLEAILG
ncbi:uncharacterized protein LOC115626974 [Scaptodrosophila lebanonensis]|uniref:Uncharacterized protein LOC115626974 n=1 Tax=Drosophila lebanonensis TaxID=7225 RepID=A0A6J2TQP0_DROLE|nr:uncharacterized protein LOC115626974 [Scaptodrosophila lebanonensis]